MKNAKLVPLLALAVLMAAGSALGQMSDRSITVNLPFSFRAGDRLLPAGEYRLNAVSQTGVVSLTGAGEQMVGTHAIQQAEPSLVTKLIFKKLGSQYFLSQIWVEGQERGRELPTSRLQRELAKNAAADAVSILAEK